MEMEPLKEMEMVVICELTDIPEEERDEYAREMLTNYGGQSFIIYKEHNSLIDMVLMRTKDGNLMFPKKWCKRLENPIATPKKAGIEMISDEHIAENSGMDKFPIENYIKSFSQTNNNTPHTEKVIDWEQRKYELTKEFMTSQIASYISSNRHWSPTESIAEAILWANEMVNRLKKV